MVRFGLVWIQWPLSARYIDPRRPAHGRAAAESVRTRLRGSKKRVVLLASL